MTAHGDFDVMAMDLALAQAREAAALGEAPVGACVFRGEELVSAAFNRRETDRSALAHAELLAIQAANSALNGWRLQECTLYVTLEPCPMCTGAIINARIRRVVYGAADPKAGCMGSVLRLTDYPFNHRPEIEGGVRADECARLLSDFFAALRRRKQPPAPQPADL